MSLVALRAAVVGHIAESVTAFRTVQAHGGSFNREELARIALQSPACLVAVMGGELERHAGQPVATPTIFAFIVTRGSSAEKRDEAALVLVEAVAGLVVNNGWDYADAQAPDNMRIENLYSGDIDKQGIALWSVSWQQQTDIGVYDDSDLGYLHQVHAEWDLVPADGQIDAEQTIQLTGDFMSAYGNLNIGTPAATSIGTPDTYVKAAGTFALNLYKDMDMPVTGRLRHTGTVAKPFLATASVSVTVGTDAKVTLAFAKGGVVDTDSEIEQECTVAGGAEAFSLKHIFSLDENEYVEIWIKADTAIAATLTKADLVLAAT